MIVRIRPGRRPAAQIRLRILVSRPRTHTHLPFPAPGTAAPESDARHPPTPPPPPPPRFIWQSRGLTDTDTPRHAKSNNTYHNHIFVHLPVPPSSSSSLVANLQPPRADRVGDAGRRAEAARIRMRQCFSRHRVPPPPLFHSPPSPRAHRDPFPSPQVLSQLAQALRPATVASAPPARTYSAAAKEVSATSLSPRRFPCVPSRRVAESTLFFSQLGKGMGTIVCLSVSAPVDWFLAVIRVAPRLASPIVLSYAYFSCGCETLSSRLDFRNLFFFHFPET